MTELDERPETFPLDNTDPALFTHLFDTLNQMRDQCPVAWSPSFGGFWALSKYDDVVKAAGDWQHFTTTQGIMVPPTGASMKVIPAELDPPRHTKFRKLLLPYFTERALQRWVPGIEKIIDDAFAPVLPAGRADLVTDVAHPVPVLAISLILGMLDADWRRIRELAANFLAATGKPELARQRARELEAYLEEQITRRRGAPATDVLGELVNAELPADEEPITAAEFLGMVQLMVVAGHETTVNGMATMTYRLISEPGLKERLLADRSLTDAMIDETLRLHPPVWNMGRTIATDTEVRGTAMCPGEKVMLVYGAANRDPDRFPDPERFDIGRASNQHLTFGSGRHRCVGEPLAKLELRLTLDYVLDKIPDVELDGEPVWGGGTNQHGLRSLPVRFTPRAAADAGER
ncbi:cytochrome P450 [uncultured Jatrophihabitans sp.]|uniref:cytochrome P450 n=1 Tax=uncultured Jatrophihabitans sp. TaxID=1610747 RepID=UPI0035CC83E1